MASTLRLTRYKLWELQSGERENTLIIDFVPVDSLQLLKERRDFVAIGSAKGVQCERLGGSRHGGSEACELAKHHECWMVLILNRI